MTVDSGHLWVAESTGTGNSRVDEFDAATGAFLSQLPQESALTETDQGIAVGHVGAGKEEEVYVGASGGEELLHGEHESVVAVLGPSESLQATWTGAHTPNKSFVAHEGERVGPISGVAVDNNETTSGGDWAAGDVYVATASAVLSSYNVVDVFKPEAGGKEPGQIVAQLTGTCSLPGKCPGGVIPFTFPVGVAVDQSTGDVLVADEPRNGALGGKVVDVFEPTGSDEYAFVRQLTGTPTGPSGTEMPFNGRINVSVDGGNGDIYVSEFESGIVYQFNSAGKFLDSLSGTPAGPFGSLGAVAIDPASHHVYVGGHNLETQAGVLDVFGANAVIPNVMVTEPVSSLTPTSATLRGKVNPEEAGEATCEFEYGTSTSYGQRAKCTKPVPNVNVEEPVESVSITGLSPDTIYHYRLDAANENGTNSGQGPEGPQDLGEFTTRGPGIHSESVSDVKSTSATFEATINPHNTPTTYRFEYLTEAAYIENGGSFSGPQPAISVPQPDGAVGSEEGDVEVAQHVQVGLSAGTVYHYRVVAVSEIEVAPEEFKTEEFDDEDQIFRTQAAGAFGLADGRAWEMVSPPDKHGANILAPTEGVYAFQAAAAGDAMSYVATAPTESQPQGFDNVMQVLSTRGPAGWGSRDIGVAHKGATGASPSFAEYSLFSSDLSLGAVHPFGVFDPAVSAEASENTPYLRTDYPSGNVNASCEKSCYRPLVTGKEGYANVPEPGTEFGGQTEGKCEVICGPEFLGATPDLSHIVLRSGVALTKTPVDRGLYEWAAGKLQLVSVLPASEGGGAVSGALGNDVEAKEARAGTISNDGMRVIWATSGSALYMSDTATAETKTIRLDVAEPTCIIHNTCGSGAAEPKFQLASSGGSKVLFTDTQRLTENAGTKTGEPDLYECEIFEAKAGELECRLSDLTPSHLNESADVQAGGPGPSQGAVVGASEDGSWVYFVADGVLAAGAEHGHPNLYVRHAGVTKLVAVLSGADYPGWAGGSEGGGQITAISARVSPDGRWLAFMSQRSLTGYDNGDVTGKKVGERLDEEVYLYDASSERLVCASCNPTGARPLGVVFGKQLNEQEEEFLGGNRAWESGPETRFAALIPGWTRELYQSRYLSDSGRLFFESHDALVPQDVNGTWDVYEYEPEGVPESEHTCTSAVQSGSEVFKPARTVEVEGRRVEEGAGCVGLISSGTSAELSAFLDASETGGDVFFLTTSRLAPQDFDTSYDVYDAHECTVAAPCVTSLVAPPECTTADACRAAPAPQPEIFGSGPSETFSGAGNIKPSASKPLVKSKTLTRAQKLAKALKLCKKDNKSKKKQIACEKQAQKRYGALKAKKAGNKRRAKS